MSENIKIYKKTEEGLPENFITTSGCTVTVICARRITGSYAAGDCHCRSKKL